MLETGAQGADSSAPGQTNQPDSGASPQQPAAEREAGRKLDDAATAGREALDEAKATGVQTAQAAQDEAERLAVEARDATVSAAREVAAQAKSQTRQVLHARKKQAASEVETFRKATQSAANRLREDGDGNLADYVEKAADRLEEVRTYLDETRLETMVSDVSRFARRRPEVFIGGAVIAGMAIARFLKASTPPDGGYYAGDGELIVRGRPGVRPGRGVGSRPIGAGAASITGDGIARRYPEQPARMDTMPAYAADHGHDPHRAVGPAGQHDEPHGSLDASHDDRGGRA